MIDKVKPTSAAGQMLQKAFASNLLTLGAASALQSAKGLRSPALEAKFANKMLHWGLAGVGSVAEKEAVQHVIKTKAGAAISGKTAEAVASKIGQQGAQAGAQNVGKGRAGLFSSVLVFAGGYVKLQKNNGNIDARTALDITGSIFGGIGEVLGYRAKMYEETVYKGIKGANLYKLKAYQEAYDKMSAVHLKALRVTALKFAGPAAIISMVLEGLDANTSFQRKNKALGWAQAISVVGTGIGLLGIGATAVSSAIATPALAALAASTGAVLSFVGALVAGVALVAVWVLSDKEWRTWLQDFPLYKKRGTYAPIHQSLQDTLNKLQLAKASTQ